MQPIITNLPHFTYCTRIIQNVNILLIFVYLNGNPLTYDGYTFTWEEGRQLERIQGNGLNISYKYNDQGIRTEKTINGVTTKYYLLGDKVILETNGTDTIHYSYDTQDNLVSMNLNGVEYYYVRNGQGDIIALIDANGYEVATYTYDSWGKIISIDGSLKDTVGVKNPYRYRGYRYDEETKLYYLQSRYYNPEWGRFANADAIVGENGELLSHNMFAYCSNDPVNMEDPDGDIAWWVGAAISGAAFDSAVYLLQHRNGGFSWSGLGKAVATGAITGVALAGAGNFIAKGVRALVSARKAKTIIKGGSKAVSVTNKLIKFKGDEAVAHFEKHGKEFMDALGKYTYNLKDYINDANHVIQNGTYVEELNGYVQLIGGKGSAKYGFVGLDRATGHITTFHIKTASELAKKAPSLGIIK
ncbi:MAG: RHS repeat-associated core domain-containing protein [Caloramator sp.]|nr:RHS repeat-associated core domain-containing protein [Caloramator sp.]